MAAFLKKSDDFEVLATDDGVDCRCWGSCKKLDPSFVGFVDDGWLDVINFDDGRSALGGDGALGVLRVRVELGFNFGPWLANDKIEFRRTDARRIFL